MLPIICFFSYCGMFSPFSPDFLRYVPYSPKNFPRKSWNISFGQPQDCPYLPDLSQKSSHPPSYFPMISLGHRGCRLAITYPEICQMQTRAIFEAVASLGRRQQVVPTVEVMVPLVSHVEEPLVVDRIDLAMKNDGFFTLKMMCLMGDLWKTLWLNWFT